MRLAAAAGASVLATVFLLQGVGLPFLVKGGPSGDFQTIYTLTRKFFGGENIYAGTNPYFPATFVVMGWQCFLSVANAWLAWRLIGLGILVATVFWGYRYLSEYVPPSLSLFALANVLMLAGFSPKSGNPGNLVGMLVVLSFFLSSLNRQIAAGVLLGIACALKWSLALPFLILGYLAREHRTAIVALICWLGLEAVGTAIYLANGFSLDSILRGITSGIWQVGGYGDYGFRRWFASSNVYRVQLLNISPLLHSFGLPHPLVNLLSLLGAIGFGLLSCYFALRSRMTIVGYALAAPAMLLFTYHRFYDSAILAFPVLLAWQSRRENPLPSTWIVGLSVAFFFNLSNIILALSRAPEVLDNLFIWRYVIGPHHVYCLSAILALTLFLIARRSSTEPEKENRDKGTEGKQAEQRGQVLVNA